jgi:hypothetical protein
VNVVGGAVTDVAFPVSCTPNPTLQVTVTTTGASIPAQYFVGVDFYYFYDYYLFGLTVPANGTASIRLPPGGHDVNLAGVPANCTVTSANPLSVTMSLGATASVAFTVVCR